MNKLVRCDFEEETSTGRYKKRVEKNKGNEGYSCVGLSNKYPNLDELSGSRTSTTTPWSRFAGRAEMIISCAFVLRRHQSKRYMKSVSILRSGTRSMGSSALTASLTLDRFI